MTRTSVELDCEPILELVRVRAGLFFGPNRALTVRNAIRRLMEQAELRDSAALCRLLEHDHSWFDRLIDDLTVRETYFFREPKQFDLLRETVLPEICARRGPEHVLRLWSAGCASGEEPYSLAILADQELLLNRVHILGTDISHRSLVKAQSAQYEPWSFRGVAEPVISRYFQRDDRRFRLADRIRKVVRLAYLNLAQDSFPTLAEDIWGMDVILCRNVLIYLDRPQIEAVANRLLRTLADGGWLLTGPSDPLLGECAPFETVLTDAGVVYRRLISRAAHRQLQVPTDENACGWSQPFRPQSSAQSPVAVPTPRTDSPTTGAASSTFADPPGSLPFPGLRVGSDPGSEAASVPPAGLASATGSDPLETARAAFARGDYSAVVASLCEPTQPEQAALQIRALANLGRTTEAKDVASQALARFPLSCELHFLHAVLLLTLGETAAADEAVRRVLFLDRSQVAAHFLRGTVLQAQGDIAAARRAYEEAYRFAAQLPTDEPVALADFEPAGQLARCAKEMITLLQT
jgi:chemotaxis protein methyltransferase CheR